jgi:hypothetical protein
MQKQRDEFEAARQELLSSYTNEMERRDKLLAEQATANKLSRKVYEEEVRTKYPLEKRKKRKKKLLEGLLIFWRLIIYLSMIEQHSAALQQEQRQSLEKEMAELENRAAAELQRVRTLEDAEKKFQEEAKQKYETLISELEQSWKREITNRSPPPPSPNSLQN